MTTFQVSPPPKQKPTTPMEPVDCVLRTVIPSVVAAAGGVAKGDGLAGGVAVGAAAALEAGAVADGAPPQAATIVAARTALPLISVTRRSSSRRGIRPSRYSSMCSSIR